MASVLGNTVRTSAVGAGVQLITLVLLEAAEVTRPRGPGPTDLMTRVLGVRGRRRRLLLVRLLVLLAHDDDDDDVLSRLVVSVGLGG